MTLLNPYLHFRSDARAAIAFYASVFGGEPSLSTFADYQMPGIGDDEADLVMHAQLETPGGLTLMVADTPRSMPLAEAGNITLSLSGDDEAELRRFWDGLADGGTVAMPLEPAPWGGHFGQLTDRYGVSWYVNIDTSASSPAESGAPEAAPAEV